MASKSLSPKSPYEQTFKTRYRPSGRPSGENVFPSVEESGLDPSVHLVAKRRAQAVVLAENRERMAEVFSAEAAVLRRRGLEQVLEDARMAPVDSEGGE